MVVRFVLIALCLMSMAQGECKNPSMMSVEEKIGQLLMVHFNGNSANEDARILIQELHVGSIIYYTWANELSSHEQVRTLSVGLHQLAAETRLAIPLLIAVDQEGGRIVRLTTGFTSFPGNQALGLTGDPSLAEQCAYTIGRELTAVGINMNLAPVVDINSNPNNPVIGSRSFGSSPELVTSFAEKFLDGCAKAGILHCLKHFPGHGDVVVDSHHDLPVVNKPLEELKKMELVPFQQLASRADAIMTAHLLVPALDPDHCSTLSKKTIDFLRQEVGYEGVIITDSLVMEGVLKGRTIDEVALMALKAGCDLLLLGGKQLVGTGSGLELTVDDMRRIHQRLVDAVRTGELSEESIDTSVARVMALKACHFSYPVD